MKKCSLQNTSPIRHPAQRQAKAPDQHSQLGAAAEVLPLLEGAGPIPQAAALPQPLGVVPRPPTPVYSLKLPLEQEPTDSLSAKGSGSATCQVALGRAVGAPLRAATSAQREYPHARSVAARAC